MDTGREKRCSSGLMTMLMVMLVWIMATLSEAKLIHGTVAAGSRVCERCTPSSHCQNGAISGLCNISLPF